MADSQASAGQQGRKNEKPKESIEIFPEAEVIAEGKDLQDESLEKMKNTQTSKNLERALIKNINIGEETIGLPINQKLLERIYTEQVNLDISSSKFEGAFKEYSKIFFTGINFQNIPKSRTDFYKQSLGIIVACYESSTINLSPDDTEELCHILLPLVSKSKESIPETDIENNEEIEEAISFTDDPAGPLFIRLRSEGIISEEEFQTLNTEYEAKGSFQNIDFTEHSETIQKYLEQVNGTEETTIENNKNAFLDDFKNTEIGIAEVDIENDITAKLIAESYIQIKKPGEEKHSKWKDYGTAVKIAKNKILLNDYTINRDREDFKKAVLYIESGIPINQYVGLQTIIALKGMAPGKFASIEKQNRKTRLTELLEKSLENDEKDRNNKKAKLKKIQSEEVENMESEEFPDFDNDELFQNSGNPNLNEGNEKIEVGNTKTINENIQK